MDKKLFKKTEERMRNYYSKDKKIKSIKEKIKFLEDRIEVLAYRIENNDFCIPSNLKGMGISERVQTSCSGSPIEKSMIEVIEEYEKQIAKNIKEINYLENCIYDIEKDYKVIDCNITSLLGEEHKKFLEEAYKECLPNWKLANKYHMSEVSCTRKKKRLMRQVIKWEEEMLNEHLDEII